MYTESKRNKLEAKYKVNTAHSLRAISTALFKFFPVFFSFNNIHSFPLDLIFYVFIFSIALVFVLIISSVFQEPHAQFFLQLHTFFH